MNRSTLRRRMQFCLPALGIILISFGPVSVSWAQKKKAGPPTGSPTMAFSLPLGCQRGVPQELILTGTNLTPAAQFHVGFPAKVEIIDDEKLTAEGKVKVIVTAAADVPMGLYPVRLLASGGVSNLRLFAVDELPQVIDNDANHDKAKPQDVPVPSVVAGRIVAEQANYYRIKATPGQRLSFEILGRRLGSPIDPIISIYGGKNLREIIHDNDSPGAQGDPRLSYTFKEAGDYLVEVRDVVGRGGPDFVYRLRIGDFPLASSPIPMAVKAGEKVSVTFAGTYAEGVKPVEIVAPKTVGSIVWVAPKAGGVSGWPVPLFVSGVDQIVEKEPNQNAAQATRVPVPGGVTGRFLPGDEADVYVIAVKKGDKLAAEVKTLEWGSPTLVYLTLKNAKTGAEMAKSNPTAVPPLDQRLEFTAAEDGDVLIEVQHLLYHGSPSETYHLSLGPVTPTLDVILSSDRAEAAAGATAALPFTVVRKGFAGPVEVKIRGDAAGVKLKANQNAGILLIPSKDDAPLAMRDLIIDATAVIDGKPVVVAAHFRPSLAKSLADLVFPPIDVATQAVVAVKGKAPFSLAAKLEPADAVPGSTPSVIITATREPGFTEEIVINPPAGLPANAGAKPVNIAKDKNETKFPLDINAKVAIGEYFVLFSGKAKLDKKDVLSDPAVLPLAVVAPFELTAEPAEIRIAPGEKVKLTLKAVRKHGYKGPIAIEVKNLPMKITGGKANFNPDQAMIEVELAAAPDTPVADRIDLEIVGLATAMNNLASTTGPVTLRVGKK